jgi:D-tyrosyl-tRNA(Tyr) deacylase
MKLLLQRCKKAKITIDKKIISKINHGLVIFIGIEKNDRKLNAKYLAKKVLNLRIFNDIDNKMNLSIKDINGSALIISQFTLCANVNNGRRPSYTNAGDPEFSEYLYNYFISKIKQDIFVETGVFGKNMEVDLVNSGPATFVIED